MADRSKATKRGNSKPNVKKRGSTYTYYLYVTDANGKRRQHSKGGFKTQKQAEDARIAAMNAKATGTYVKARRSAFATFSSTSGCHRVFRPLWNQALGIRTSKRSGCR